MSAKTIYTIGYEGLTMDAMLGALRHAQVDVLIDVRAVPLSRKPGFSKNKLATHLQESGIAYLSLKGLGTPAEGRAAARSGRIGDMRKIFTAHMSSEDAQRDLHTAITLSSQKTVCFLCYEQNVRECHRLLVADAVAAVTGAAIVHLDPTLAGASDAVDSY